MNKENRSILNQITDKLFGGIDMTWPKVIIYAVAAAVITFAALVIPAFKDTSFERIGVHLEAWILFAVIIMANCRTPLESALKTFVFFLISQPLIYLLQVPFNVYGWGIFRYYGYWFKLTLLTFPAAYIGWYINKKNWLSVLIFAPVIALLAGTFYAAVTDCIMVFPHLLVCALFCLMQIFIYIYVFFPDIRQKAAGWLLTAAVIGFMVFRYFNTGLGINSNMFLPDDPELSEEADLIMDSNDIIRVEIFETGTDPMVRIIADRYGSADFTIQDNGREYRYTVKIYKDNSGHTQIEITERD